MKNQKTMIRSIKNKIKTLNINCVTSVRDTISGSVESRVDSVLTNPIILSGVGSVYIATKGHCND